MYYQYMPWLFLFLSATSMLPQVIWHSQGCPIAKKVFPGMKHYNREEENARVERLVEFLDNNYPSVFLFMLKLLALDLGSLALYALQVYLCMTVKDGFLDTFSVLLADGGKAYMNLYPPQVNCSYSLVGTGGSQDYKGTVCILPQNEIYGVLLMGTGLIFTVTMVTGAFSIVGWLLFFLPSPRR